MKFLLILLLQLVSCISQNGNGDVPVEINRNNLYQQWLVSHEDFDRKSNVIVYRPSTYNFPPARAREGIEFMPEGELIELIIAPADGYIRRSGNWELNDRSELHIVFKDNKSSVRIMKILELNKNKLVIKKVD